MACVLVLLLLKCRTSRQTKTSGRLKGIRVQLTVPSTTSDASFDYMFSAIAAVRALETTHLSFTPPTPPTIGPEVQPLIVRIFDHPPLSAFLLADADTRAVPPLLHAGSRQSTPRPSSSHLSPSNTHHNAILGSTTEASPLVSPQSARALSSARPSRLVRFSTPRSGDDSHSCDIILPAHGSRLDSGTSIDPGTNGQASSRVSHRQFRAFKSSGPVKSESEDQGTAWFESQSESRIIRPPHLSDYSEVQDGDLFYHRYEGYCQLWIWLASENGQAHDWVPIRPGAKHPSNRRRLVLTESFQMPSWVTEATYNAKFRNRCQIKRSLLLPPESTRNGNELMTAETSVGPRAVHFMNNGNALLATFLTHGIRCWDFSAGSFTWCITPRTGRIGRSALSDSERVVAVSNLCDGVDLYSTVDQTFLRTIATEIRINVPMPVVFADDDTLAYRAIRAGSDVVQAIAILSRRGEKVLAFGLSEAGPRTTVAVWKTGMNGSVANVDRVDSTLTVSTVRIRGRRLLEWSRPRSPVTVRKVSSGRALRCLPIQALLLCLVGIIFMLLGAKYHKRIEQSTSWAVAVGVQGVDQFLAPCAQTIQQKAAELYDVAQLLVRDVYDSRSGLLDELFGDWRSARLSVLPAFELKMRKRLEAQTPGIQQLYVLHVTRVNYRL
ncbi:hypothetical protein FKP32DRAFT_1679792 [Trametes sanguinea]|nr:hypothetical protein FKP32DRAFT_1679792 [Trametes sanguinea]